MLAAEANGALSSPWRRGLTLLAALAGVFLVLLAARRSARDAAVPLIPIALATGWSGLVLFVLGLLPGPFEVDLNPMSVTLSALVIAISTEFSVLLSSRYRQERDAGAGPARAIELAYASTGAAVLASGATAIAGFAALVFSDIRMLRDFGIVTVVDLTVSLLGVMIVLPAALLWAEEHGPFRVRDLLAAVRPRRAARRPVTDDRDEDRFEDLSVGERLAERDRTHPEPMRRPEVPRAGNKYAWVVGILMLMGLGVLLFAETIPNQGKGLGARPASGCPRSRRIEANGDKDGDANVCQRRRCNENAGKIPACDVRGSGIVRVCPTEPGRARDDVRGHTRHRLRAAGGPG